ncbi:hypothetical protein RR48_10541 [Papilio machaon]|uniref:Uncharacterized protein n=1 Tax=Papilio machaon TaxID=76193 RepID=A0A194RAM4_PAPMA|nr:hypothetical protein RR48_10541 [Papilio machaon]
MHINFSLGRSCTTCDEHLKYRHEDMQWNNFTCKLVLKHLSQRYEGRSKSSRNGGDGVGIG